MRRHMTLVSTEKKTSRMTTLWRHVISASSTTMWRSRRGYASCLSRCTLSSSRWASPATVSWSTSCQGFTIDHPLRCFPPRWVTVGHGSIFPHPIQLNPSTYGPNPIQSNPLIAGVKSNSLTMWLLTFNRGKTGIVKSPYIMICKKQHKLCCNNY